MDIDIQITDDEIRNTCDSLGLDYDYLPTRRTVEERIYLGIKDHVNLRDWSLSELISPNLADIPVRENEGSEK